MGLTREQMNDAIKSSAITALGPSLVVLSAMIALLVSFGGPISWTRVVLHRIGHVRNDGVRFR